MTCQWCGDRHGDTLCADQRTVDRRGYFLAIIRRDLPLYRATARSPRKHYLHGYNCILPEGDTLALTGEPVYTASTVHYCRYPAMNTCAQCRFWKDVEAHRDFTFNPSTWRSDGEYKECIRANDDAAPMFLAAKHAHDEALMTRSDFGCVQFEPLADPDQCKTIRNTTDTKPGALPLDGARLEARE